MTDRDSSSKYDFCFNQSLIDAIPAPVCMQDGSGKFLGANSAFRGFFCLDQELPDTFDLNGLLQPATGAKNRDVERAILSSGGEKTFEAMVQCSGNKERSVVFHKAAVTGGNGEIVGLATTFLDLTEQRQTEQQLRHAQKMEAIGTLAGGIAHDFNNVLTPIIGYAEIMRLMATRQNEEEHSWMQYVGEILIAAKRAKSLVEQILTFSRSREKKELPQNLHPIVKEVLKLVRVTFPSSIKLIQEIDTECGMVSIDPVQLHQVLLNLCTNSAQAIGDEQGTLAVSLLKSARDEQGRDWVELRVVDSGPGIAPDLQERVFEPYFTTKEKSQGTGMGLAMVHGIVNRYGGRIELKSESGKGTAFHLYFPRVTSEEKTVQKDEFTGSLVGRERVMVVDDQEAVARVTKKILETLGYAVCTCYSSREALALFSSRPNDFDLVITDLTMPHLSGMELCAEMQKQRKTIPVILCTGYAEKISDEKLLEAGCSAWFTKPATLQKLASTVRLVLDRDKKAMM